MSQRRFHQTRRGALAVCLALATGAVSCAGDGAPPDIDSVRLKLDFGGGVTLAGVDYILTGPSSFRRIGTLSVGDQPTVTATFSNLPAGQGYDINVKGTATDDSSACKGEAMFDVAPSMNAVVQIALKCTGIVTLSSDVNICPTIDGLSVVPAEVYVGSSVQLSATAHDPDNGPSPLSASWSVSSGMLANLSIAGATFTCTEPGTFQIGLTVSDGAPNPKCADHAFVTVVCTPPPSAMLLSRSAMRAGAV